MVELNGVYKDRNIEEEISMIEVLILFKKYIICKLNLQKILFLLSFLTFGVGDIISAVYLIENRGIISEANPLIRLMYASNGSNGVIAIKLWLVVILLCVVWNLSRDKNNYWMINGFLFALFVFGLMATGANLMASRGVEYLAASTIITTYLFLVMLLTMIGDAMDRIQQYPDPEYLMKNEKIVPNSIDDSLKLPTLSESSVLVLIKSDKYEILI